MSFYGTIGHVDYDKHTLLLAVQAANVHIIMRG